MNEEIEKIKEILEDVKRHLDYVEVTKQSSIRDNEMKAMYNYITNLQEELKYQKNAELEYNDKHIILMKRYNKLKKENKNYKTKFDKVIKCINYYAIEDEDYSKIYNDEEKDLLSILQGSDEK